MNLLEAFECGAVSGIPRTPDRIVETVISKLFFFDGRVFKVYKWRNGSIGDFTDHVFRKNFLRDDFRWNAVMSPETYLRLGFVARDGARYVEVPESEAEDFFIEMRKINENTVLFNRLKEGMMSSDDLRSVVRTMFGRLGMLTASVREDFSDIFSISLPESYALDMESNREWVRSFDTSPFRKEADAIADALTRFAGTYAPFRSFSTDGYMASIDNHSGNILFHEGRTTFIDSMPPMRIWRVRPPIYVLSRPATDVEVLSGKEHADVMYDEYERIIGRSIDESERIYCQSVAALVMALYRKALGEEELSGRFLDFARKKVDALGISA